MARRKPSSALDNYYGPGKVPSLDPAGDAAAAAEESERSGFQYAYAFELGEMDVFDALVLAAVARASGKEARAARLYVAVFGDPAAPTERPASWTGSILLSRPAPKRYHEASSPERIAVVSRTRMLDQSFQRLRKAGKIVSVRQQWRIA